MSYDDTRYRRLPNWGLWASQDPDAPDKSCRNSIYEMGPACDADGWGEVDGDTIVVPQVTETQGERPEVDELDAERVDFMVRQMLRGHRTILVRRFSLRERLRNDEVDNAVWALVRMFDAVAATTARMQALLRFRHP